MFDGNMVLHVIEEHFWHELEAFTIQCVMELESDELENMFELPVDYADFDTIDKVEADDIEVEEEDTYITVTGKLAVKVIVDGYTHWDGENVFVDTAVYALSLIFYFDAAGGRYSKFELQYDY